MLYHWIALILAVASAVGAWRLYKDATAAGLR